MRLGNDDRQRYNAFVAQSPLCNFLQSWEWGELKQRTGWEPVRLGIEKDGKLCAAIQVLKRTAPGVGRSLLYAPRGPIYDLQRPELFEQIIDEVGNLASESKAMALKIDPAVPNENDDFKQLLRDHGFEPIYSDDDMPENSFGGTQPRFVMQVDLTPSEDDLMAAFKSKWRYNIRLAERKGVEIHTDCSREDVGEFYRVLKTTADRQDFNVRAEEYFYHIWDLFIEPGMGTMMLGSYEDEIIAGVMTLTMGDRAWYVYGASSNEHRDRMPNHRLQWEMMRWAKSQGCTVYDMRGVAHKEDKDSPLYGLNRFKKGFNAEYVEYVGEWDLVYSPTFYALFNSLEPVVRKLRLFVADFNN
ncbi:MAG: peptidoglycan bridge formation glycyltransferase FemA/FemB family protein [Armatimonadota bacterium]